MRNDFFDRDFDKIECGREFGCEYEGIGEIAKGLLRD